MKKNKIRVVISTILLSFVFLTSCGTKKTDINFTIGYNGANTLFPQKTEVIINGLDEWNNLHNDMARFNELDAKYNEKFFENSSLIICVFISDYSPAQVKINKITKNKNKITIFATNNSGDSAVLTEGVFILEVKKTDVQNVNVLQVNLQ